MMNQNQARDPAHEAHSGAGVEAGRENPGFREQVTEKTGELKDRVRRGWEDGRHKAEEAAHRGGEKGEYFLMRRQRYAAEEVRHLGKSVRQAAEKLRHEEDPNLARYADRLADGLYGLSDYLEERHPREILRQAGELAGRKPEWVAGGMFAAGLVLARFLKASAPEETRGGPPAEKAPEEAGEPAREGAGYPETVPPQVGRYGETYTSRPPGGQAAEGL